MKTSTITDSKKKKNVLIEATAAAIWLLLWQIVSSVIALPLLLPSPVMVIKRLWELCMTLSFWMTVATSCIRVLIGFFGGVLFGTVLAVLAWRYVFAQAMIRPLIGVLKATPVASFIILALVWIQTEQLATVVSMIMVVPLVYHNVKEGLDSADVQLLEMAKVFELSRIKTFRACYLPAVLPFFLSALTSALGFAWKSGIAAEVLGRPLMAIGKQIYDSKVYLETTDLFAWTVTVILLSVLLEHCIVCLTKMLAKKSVRVKRG